MCMVFFLFSCIVDFWVVCALVLGVAFGAQNLVPEVERIANQVRIGFIHVWNLFCEF